MDNENLILPHAASNGDARAVSSAPGGRYSQTPIGNAAPVNGDVAASLAGLAGSVDTSFSHAGEKGVRRGKPNFSELGRRKQFSTPVLGPGVSLSETATRLAEHTGSTLTTAWLEYLNASAKAANRVYESAVVDAAEEEERREAFRLPQRNHLVAQLGSLNSEAEEIQSLQRERRREMERGLAAQRLVAGSAVVTPETLDEAVRRRALLEMGTPGFLPKPGAKRKEKAAGNGVSDILVKWVLPLLFALPVGISFGLNFHLFGTRVLEEPGDAAGPLLGTILIGYVLEVILGALAGYAGNAEKGEATTPARLVWHGLFYVALAAAVANEALALYHVNQDSGGDQPFALFLLVGLLLNATYVGFRVAQAAHERQVQSKMQALKSATEFVKLAEAVGGHHRGEERLRQITSEILRLRAEFEETLVPNLQGQTARMVGQYEGEARAARHAAEREAKRVIRSLRPSPLAALSTRTGNAGH